MKGKKQFWSFKAKSDSVAELHLYGDISSSSWWGDEVTPTQFKADLDALGDVAEINIFINSDGGDVFAGQAIHSMMKRHKAKINIYVDGLAASIASVIAMAGDKVYMPRNAMMMLHNPWTWSYGNAGDFRKLADDLDAIRESMIAAYQDKSGLDREKIIEILDAETWLTAEEAVEYGFADEVESSKEIAASVKNGVLSVNGQEMDLSKFRNSPKILVANAPKTPEKVIEVNEEKKQAPLAIFEEEFNQIEKGRCL